ncbi:T9SS-dependent choice-of-anchor J family protein [Flavobacterium sp.]|uniref:T9SS-dependent choice-of-anchor J family protein n=1 Tax=Flavobacterium sp. TaxID=239 RepID=UPI00286E8C61|nr:T9SS type A sorting domain-containing protein [Flavobacterium sp.]
MNNFIRHTLLLVLFVFGTYESRAQITIFDQTMLTQASYNLFTPVSVIGTQNWTFSSSYGAVCSGYSAGLNYENEDWLVSPAMNLAQTTNTKLTFSHARGSTPFVNVGVAEGWYKVFATANYTGDPVTTTWIELTGFNQDITVGWMYVASGDVSIPEAAKSATSRIAFRYQSSASQSATWELKNVKVTADSPVNSNTAGFKITTWNTEWLGCTTFGPTDENLQLSNVAAAMLAMNSDVYCIQEVANTLTIEELVNSMGNDVWEGKYIEAFNCIQRQAIIYKKAKVQYVNSSLLSSGNAAQGNSYYYNWSSGRYPAVFNLNLVAGSNLVPLTIINIHAKAENTQDPMNYTRRLGASQALKTILDGSNYSTKNLLLIGDYNDYLIGTSSAVCSCTDSPYKNFIDDTLNYTGTTQYLNNAYSNGPLIDNIMFTNELSGNYVLNSTAQEIAVTENIIDYRNTTSDHLPVSASFEFSTLSNPIYTYNPLNLLTVYPNPVRHELSFDGTGLEDAAVSIYDLSGRQMRSEKLSATVINVSALSSGIYILKVGRRFGRFVKK